MNININEEINIIINIQDIDEIRDVEWSGTDCLLSWNCLGVWQVDR